MVTLPDDVLEFDLADEAATAALAGRVAAVAGRGDVVALFGDLGSGKTVFARAAIQHLLGRPEEVPSPTYTLVQSYEGWTSSIHHFDFYRLEQPDDALELGIEDAFADGLCLLEWPERLGALLPSDRLDVHLFQGADFNARRARLTGHGYWQARISESLGEAMIHG